MQSGHGTPRLKETWLIVGKYGRSLYQSEKTVPRSLVPYHEKIKSMSLHAFGDATLN